MEAQEKAEIQKSWQKHLPKQQINIVVEDEKIEKILDSIQQISSSLTITVIDYMHTAA